MTEVLQISPTDPDPAVLARAGAVLRAGGLVAYPTETVYGLAAGAFLADGVARVFEAKQRPLDQALPVQIADIAEVESLARDVGPEAMRLIADFFPGPLTLVLWRRPSVPLAVTGGGDTVGLRMPDHAVALGVLRASGGPLVCTSGNLTGRRSPMSARDGPPFAHVRPRRSGRPGRPHRPHFRRRRDGGPDGEHGAGPDDAARPSAARGQDRAGRVGALSGDREPALKGRSTNGRKPLRGWEASRRGGPCVRPRLMCSPSGDVFALR